MKKYVLLLVVVTFFVSCSDQKSVDFSKTHKERVVLDTINNSILSGNREIECYAMKTVDAILIDKNDVFGHYTEPIKILFYINKDKIVKLEASTFCQLGTNYKIIPCNTVELSYDVMVLSDNEGNSRMELGGEATILVNDDIYLFFSDRNTCDNTFKLLKKWQKEIEDQKDINV